MIEFLKAFKILVIFINPWVLIPAICAGIFIFVILMISYRKEAKAAHKIQDPLDWIEDAPYEE